MPLSELQGSQYIDFKIADQSKEFHDRMNHVDICNRIKKAINDEHQAIIEYKGLILHHYPQLSDAFRETIAEISKDETDHRAKFEVMLHDLKCL